MQIDKKTSDYFRNIKQIFLYLSDKCNLLCQQCLYKPNVLFEKNIPITTSKQLLKVFRELGAYKLTLLGGEISLVDIENQWNELYNLLKYTRYLNFQYVRIDTNGQINAFFREKRLFQYIDEVSFSIDGFNSETNDILRGKGSFDQAVKSIKVLKESGENIRINITSCIARQNTQSAGGISDFINNMIIFAHDIGIDQLNFHGVFKMGVPMDAWTEGSHLDPLIWNRYITGLNYDLIRHSDVDVRFPLHIISKEEFAKHPYYYGYCPCKLGERALIHPDGIIRVCSSMLSTPYGVAHYNENEIVWNEYNNELINHKMKEFTPCTNQKLLYSETLCPICFSIKPYQNEIVWKNNNIEGLRSK